MSGSVQLPDYAYHQEMGGCKGPVNALLFSPDGKLLISGGDDECVRIWNVETFRTEITLSQRRWAQITCLAWIFVDVPVDNKCTILAVGTGRGTISLCPMTKTAPFIAMNEAMTSAAFEFNDAVEAMAYDRINSKLAVTSHSGDVAIYSVDKLILTLLWTKSMKEVIPRAVFFHGPANSLLLILGLETGDVYCREVDGASILWKKTCEGPIGNAALSSDHSTLIVDNLLNRSFDVYFIPSIARPASLAFSAKPRYPRQCIFSENAKIAVCGSTINKVYVVDVTANEIVQTLEAGEDTCMVQTVAATAGNKNGALIAGGSNKGVIFLWKRLAADNIAERSAAEPDGTPPQQTTVTTNTDPINPQVVLLIFVLTWNSWYPYVKELITSAYELVVQQLPTA